MKISVLANLYGHKTLDEALSIISGLGVHAVEIGAGGYPGKSHCNPAELLADDKAYGKFIDTFKKYNTEVAALACHGNPVHPDKATAQSYDIDFRNAILLAEKMGVDPAVMANPLISTVTDAVSLLIYIYVAKLILHI